MPRASTVITLVVLGTALSLIGWSCYNAMQEENRASHGHHAGHRGSFLWFWGGGGGGGSRGANPAAGGVSRGGFGGAGGGASVGS